MFTGIVEETGTVADATETEDGRRLTIRADRVLGDVAHGASIAVSGVCLTVEAFDDETFEVFLAEETVEKTYLGDVTVGDVVNLERAMPADGRFDGHIVQGHVDAVATVTNVDSTGGEDWFFEFALPDEYADYVVAKGSITLDGISLTVADLRETDDGPRVTVAIVPTTYDVTTLSEKAVGDPVHLEVDVVGKYVASLLSGYRD
ncbi:riboflavin synthase [Halorubellus sp. JP-L1]|uniref:riboflavin synthase n=1 Tax=Halorubellus sp. JP-L1 TaxID=2715753 RepID=UPI0014085B66|nr:riboflavin synthase [Halorubellus sp. JP-L1]NHN42008.1 riboflavin synthase [Halorubellus sp. JP-L1]